MIHLGDPADVRAMLLHMAAASAREPEGRLRLQSWLRAALALVEDEGPAPQAPPPVLGPPALKALEELAFALALAAEHAEFLANRVGGRDA